MLGSFRHEGELPCRVQVSLILDRHDGGAFGEHHGETYQVSTSAMRIVPLFHPGLDFSKMAGVRLVSDVSVRHRRCTSPMFQTLTSFTLGDAQDSGSLAGV